MMIRYNAARRGGESDVLPHLESHRPGVVSFTATCWQSLLRRPRAWPNIAPVATAGECYRFVLSNSHVDVCLTALTSLRPFDENLKGVRQGPLDCDHLEYMRRFGDAVHGAAKRRPRFLGL